MNGCTQGTIITGIRSNRYPDCESYGILVSARCDLANEKINKVFYLQACPFEQWITSNVALKMFSTNTVKELDKKIKCTLDEVELDWDVLKLFSEDEFETVTSLPENNVYSKINGDYTKYKRYTSSTLSITEKRLLLSEIKNTVSEICSNMISGQYSHYTFLPGTAFNGTRNIGSGFLIDHQELDFMTLDTLKKIQDGKMDDKNFDLTQKEKEFYNKKFKILESPGFALLDGCIEPPWIEYLLQRFSNSFSRIGVDLPDRKEIKEYFKNF